MMKIEPHRDMQSDQDSRQDVLVWGCIDRRMSEAILKIHLGGPGCVPQQDCLALLPVLIRTGTVDIYLVQLTSFWMSLSPCHPSIR